MKIDLHVHIKRTSRCAKEDIEGMALKAKEFGFGGIVVLDHNYQATSEECKAAQDKVGIYVFRGVEVNVCKEDVVIVSDKTMDFLPPYKHSLEDLDKLSNWVEDTGSLAILAHPFRRHDITIDFCRFKPCAIEIASRHIDVKNRQKIWEVAKTHNMIMVSVSDAHKAKQLGGFCIDLKNNVMNERELITEIKQRRFDLMEMRLVPILGYEKPYMF